jgi:regulatory protein
MAMNEWSMAQLTAKAEAYCASAEHCISEIRSKLQQWEATDEQCDTIIAHLLHTNYINEQRYCHAFAHDKVAYQGWGKLKIRAHLYAKQLPAEAITQALDNIDENEYQKTLEHVISSKKRSLKSTDSTAREKLIRFCLQRGFTYEEISKHL